MRWLVGDLQGCARPFERLLKKIRFNENEDELWCLGDLVNKGPDSAECIRIWRDVGGKGVIGNHDVYALLVDSGEWKRKRDTLDDLFDADDRKKLLKSLRKLPLMAHLPAEDDSVRDVWVVHGGIHPKWKELAPIAKRNAKAKHDDDWLCSDDVQFATRVRCCDRKGEMSRETGPPHKCEPPYQPWGDFYKGDALIVHGHWARRGYYRTKRTLGLDTGCCYGGPLTAWCQEEDRVVQVSGER